MSALSQRHAEGIFYTPDFITEYIIKKSLIYYLRRNNKTETVDQLIEENKNSIDSFEIRIQKLKIIDPACGTGAFLIKAVEILTEIFFRILEFREKKKFDEIKIRKRIVSNCIYGVDVNPKAVEKLIKIFSQINEDDEIFCLKLKSHFKNGNSIVFNDKFAENAFKWSKEFPDIFQNGGFDIIIGNPPWGADFSNIKEYIITEYEPIASGQFDSFGIFLYQNLRDLLKPKGVLGYIVPNELCLEDVNKNLRDYLLKHQILELINLGYEIFGEVTKPSLVTLIKNCPPSIPTKVLVGLTKEEKGSLKKKKIKIEDLMTRAYLRNQASFKHNELHRINIWATELDLEIAKIIKQNNFLEFGEIVKNGRGIDTNREGRYLVCPRCSYLNPPFGTGKAGRISEKECVNNGCIYVFYRDSVEKYQKEYIFAEKDFKASLGSPGVVPGYIGRDLHKFRFNRKPRSFKYFGDKIDNKEYARYSKIAWKNLQLYQGEKILIRKVSSGNVPEVMIHNGLLVFNQQIYCFQKRDKQSQISLLFYLAIIASRLFHYYYVKQFGDPDKEILPHFTQSKILKMPVPFPDIQNDKYSKLISITQKTIEYIERFCGEFLTTTKLNKNHGEREKKKKRDRNFINDLFKGLDELVFEYYNISDSLHKERITSIADQSGFRVF